MTAFEGKRFVVTGAESGIGNAVAERLLSRWRGSRFAGPAIEFVNRRPKPLALYVFTASRRLAKSLVDAIPSGGAVVNHVAMHCLVPQLPFGGVGASGMGAYHGRWGSRP